MTSDSVTLCDMDCDLSSSGWLTYGALEMCNSNDWWFVSQYLFVIIWLLARHKLAIENWQIAGTVLLCMLLLYWVVLSFMCDVGWVALITEGGHDVTEQVPLQAKSLKCDEYVSLVFLLLLLSIALAWSLVGRVLLCYITPATYPVSLALFSHFNGHFPDVRYLG